MRCLKCNTENTKAFSFCSNCGAKLVDEPPDNYHIHVHKTKVFFFTLLGYIGLLHFIDFETSYLTSLLTDLIFALIIVVFFALNYKDQLILLKPRIENYKLLISIAFVLIVLAFGVAYFADYLNQSVFNQSKTSYYEHYKNSPFPLLLCIISISVFPAVFEEIAFRGVLFSELLNITSVNATIIITTLLFTILHFSLISFLWIFPIGLLFGYLRSRYNNLAYGIIGHFIYNSSIVLIEYFDLN